jgi:hypothetical protein
MPIPHLANPAEELLREQQLLSKTDTDIEQGWTRLRDQQDLVSKLQTSGRDIRQAERLMQLTKRTLVEWERHRRLIEQRIAYLERAVAAP